MNLHTIDRTDALEKLERVAIAAQEHVLPVVDAFAGRGIRERCRATAERRPRFENEHARTFFRELGGR